MRQFMMKTLHWLLLALATTAFAISGCKKSETIPSPQVNGVTVDMPKLQDAFKGASPDVLGQVTQVSYGIRYGDYMKAMEALDKLSNDPNTTEAQKKVVNEVIEQVKQVMNAAPKQ